MSGIWYFDIVSPFAYLSLAEVESLPRELDIAFKPVLFGAMLGHWGQLGPAEIMPKRRHTYRICQWKAREMGIAMRFPPCHPFNPLGLLRILTALDGRKDAVRLAFDLVWREGCDGQAPETLRLFCERLGIADPEALVEGADAKAKLRRETEAAVAAGVFGVPTLAVRGELFWGLDAMPMAKAFLADPALFADEEMRRLDHLPKGIERRR